MRRNWIIVCSMALLLIGGCSRGERTMGTGTAEFGSEVITTTSAEELGHSKYMTLELAKQVCATFPYTGDKDCFTMVDNAAAKLNEVVDVKAVSVGSGLPAYEFYMDDTKNRVLHVHTGGVVYADEEKQEAEQIYVFPKKDTGEIEVMPVDKKNRLLADSYEKADETQKAALQQLEEKYGKYACYYEKEIKIIMGELPADQPQITLERAREIGRDYKKQVLEGTMSDANGTAYLCEKFNEIAGAPDYADTYSESFRYDFPDGDGRFIRCCGNAAMLCDAAGNDVELLSSFS